MSTFFIRSLFAGNRNSIAIITLFDTFLLSFCCVCVCPQQFVQAFGGFTHLILCRTLLPIDWKIDAQTLVSIWKKENLWKFAHISSVENFDFQNVLHSTVFRVVWSVYKEAHRHQSTYSFAYSNASHFQRSISISSQMQQVRMCVCSHPWVSIIQNNQLNFFAYSMNFNCSLIVHSLFTWIQLWAEWTNNKKQKTGKNSMLKNLRQKPRNISLCPGNSSVCNAFEEKCPKLLLYHNGIKSYGHFVAEFFFFSKITKTNQRVCSNT